MYPYSDIVSVKRHALVNKLTIKLADSKVSFKKLADKDAFYKLLKFSWQ